MKTFGNWRKFSTQADLLAYRLKTPEAEAFHAALHDVGRSMPCLPSRKQTSKLTAEELQNIREVVGLGITLDILPVKIPATWNECLALFNRLDTTGADISDGFVVQALWSELYYWYSRHPQMERIAKAKKAKLPLHEIMEGFPGLVEASIRIWVSREALDPFSVIDLEIMYKP